MTEGEALDQIDTALSNLASIYKHLLTDALERQSFLAAVMALKNALQKASDARIHINASEFVGHVVLAAELYATGIVPFGDPELHSEIGDIEAVRDWIWE